MPRQPASIEKAGAGHQVPRTEVVFLCRLVMPGQIGFRGFLQIKGVFQKPLDVFQGIDPFQLAGVDQAHEQIPHVGTVLGLIKQGIFPVKDCMLERSLTNVVV